MAFCLWLKDVSLPIKLHFHMAFVFSNHLHFNTLTNDMISSINGKMEFEIT